MNWLRNKVNKFLRIDELSCQLRKLESEFEELSQIGVDVHFKEQSQVFIISKINGGQIRHVAAHFDSLKDLNTFSDSLKERFRTRQVVWDAPSSLRDLISQG
ncbi:MAG: hypothetical protein DRH26_02210 [Deltaproteobacteria bacterium]|nr:MAG: hypothetical protein DRH26_02210 [Deltaproteobacteria bacterium]